MDETQLRSIIAASSSRADLWTGFVNATQARTVAEIGVFRGEFAEQVLRDCAGIETYYMVDPWRRLEDWNKPANRDDDVFERFYRKAMERTAAHEAKRVVLRGKTTEVVDRIPDGALDFAYVDGDHTLRGITIDLVKVLPKLRDGGWLGGDDFSRSIWQHGDEYEPTLVFPFAVHFAEAVGARIFGLPYNQFLIEKRSDGHAFVDLTGRYGGLDLKSQIDARPAGKKPAAGWLARLARRGRGR